VQTSSACVADAIKAPVAKVVTSINSRILCSVLMALSFDLLLNSDRNDSDGEMLFVPGAFKGI